MTDLPPRPRPKLPIVHLLPNMLTVAALCAGLTAIRMAIAGQFSTAVLLIILAAILDGLDGRLARLLRSESGVGAELDSLADAISFGVAPGLTLYLWAMGETPNLGWIAALIYIACCVLRLARFNLSNRMPLVTDHGHFIGVPSPAGAMLALLPVFVHFMLPTAPQLPPQLVALWMVIIGALMIGRFQTPSFKKATIYTDQVRYIVIGFVALVAALGSYPWLTLVLLDLAYGGMLVFGWLRGRKAPPQQEAP